MNWYGHDIPDPDWVSPCGQAVMYCADCLTVLPKLPIGCVDCVVTDPPYGIGVGAAFVRRGGAAVDDGSGGFNVGDTWSWLNYIGCIRDGGNIASFHKRGDGLPPCVESWHRFYIAKPAPAPTPRPVFSSAVEECSIGRKPGKHRWFGNGCTPNLWYGLTPNRLNKSSGHPSEKPIAPIHTLVRVLSGALETVLDPFTGSGTTGVACARLGRRFLGIEIEKRYFDIAVTRIDQELRQGKLFTETTA